MAELTMKCHISLNSRPLWLLRLNCYVSQVIPGNIEPSQEDFERTRRIILGKLDQLVEDRVLTKSCVTCVAVTDEGKTVLHLYRNQSIIQTFYIE